MPTSPQPRMSQRMINKTTMLKQLDNIISQSLRIDATNGGFLRFPTPNTEPFFNVHMRIQAMSRTDTVCLKILIGKHCEYSQELVDKVLPDIGLGTFNEDFFRDTAALLDMWARNATDLTMYWNLQECLHVFAAQYRREITGRRAFDESIYEQIFSKYQTRTEFKGSDADSLWLDTWIYDFQHAFRTMDDSAIWRYLHDTIDTVQTLPVAEWWRSQIVDVWSRNLMVLTIEDTIFEIRGLQNDTKDYALSSTPTTLEKSLGNMLKVSRELMDLEYRKALDSPLSSLILLKFEKNIMEKFQSMLPEGVLLDSTPPLHKLALYTQWNWHQSIKSLIDIERLLPGYIVHAVEYTSKMEPAIFVMIHMPTKYNYHRGTRPWARDGLLRETQKFLSRLQCIVQELRKPNTTGRNNNHKGRKRRKAKKRDQRKDEILQTPTGKPTATETTLQIDAMAMLPHPTAAGGQVKVKEAACGPRAPVPTNCEIAVGEYNGMKRILRVANTSSNLEPQKTAVIGDSSRSVSNSVLCCNKFLWKLVFDTHRAVRNRIFGMESENRHAQIKMLKNAQDYLAIRESQPATLSSSTLRVINTSPISVWNQILWVAEQLHRWMVLKDSDPLCPELGVWLELRIRDTEHIMASSLIPEPQSNDFNVGSNASVTTIPTVEPSIHGSLSTAEGEICTLLSKQIFTNNSATNTPITDLEVPQTVSNDEREHPKAIIRCVPSDAKPIGPEPNAVAENTTAESLQPLAIDHDQFPVGWWGSPNRGRVQACKADDASIPNARNTVIPMPKRKASYNSAMTLSTGSVSIANSTKTLDLEAAPTNQVDSCSTMPTQHNTSPDRIKISKATRKVVPKPSTFTEHLDNMGLRPPAIETGGTLGQTTTVYSCRPVIETTYHDNSQSATAPSVHVSPGIPHNTIHNTALNTPLFPDAAGTTAPCYQELIPANPRKLRLKKYGQKLNLKEFLSLESTPCFQSPITIEILEYRRWLPLGSLQDPENYRIPVSLPMDSLSGSCERIPFTTKYSATPNYGTQSDNMANTILDRYVEANNADNKVAQSPPFGQRYPKAAGAFEPRGSSQSAGLAADPAISKHSQCQYIAGYDGNIQHHSSTDFAHRTFSLHDPFKREISGSPMASTTTESPGDISGEKVTGAAQDSCYIAVEPLMVTGLAIPMNTTRQKSPIVSTVNSDIIRTVTRGENSLEGQVGSQLTNATYPGDPSDNDSIPETHHAQDIVLGYELLQSYEVLAREQGFRQLPELPGIPCLFQPGLVSLPDSNRSLPEESTHKLKGYKQ